MCSAGLLKLLTAAETKGHANAVDPVLPSAFHIMHPVAHKNSCIPIHNMQHLQRLCNDLRLCPDGSIQCCTGNRIKIAVNLKQPQDTLYKYSWFRGRDRNFLTGLP